MHLSNEYVILEVLNEKNQMSNRGKVIFTNLDNYTVPVIRYENDDIASWADKECSCGRNVNGK